MIDRRHFLIKGGALSDRVVRPPSVRVSKKTGRPLILPLVGGSANHDRDTLQARASEGPEADGASSHQRVPVL